MIKFNERYEILTDSGWSNFGGIKTNYSTGKVIITTEFGKTLSCTTNHKIKCEDGFIEAKYIDVNMKVYTIDGIEKIVTINFFSDENFLSYDLIDVEKNNQYYTEGILSHNCEFLGSSGTLISGSALKRMTFTEALRQVLNGMDIHEEVVKDHSYVLIADTARGNGLDASAFVVIDITQKPYKMVAKYKNAFISPLLFPNIILQAAKYYNDAYLLIENNDSGGQVADILYHDLEYENMFFTEMDRGDARVSEMNKVRTMGIRTTKRTKTIGCNSIKALIENYELVINDFDVIEEFSCFILRRNGTYAAEDGKNDDMVMCLVLFGWLATQPFFRDLTNVDVRRRMYDDQMKAIEEQLASPFFSTYEDEFEDKYGVIDKGMSRGGDAVWFTVPPPSDDRW